MEASQPETTNPPASRVLAGFLIAPLFAAFAMATTLPAFDGLSIPTRILYSTFVYSVVGAYPTSLVFGVPAYFLLRRFLRPTMIKAMFAGAGIAVIPWLILATLAGSYRQSDLIGLIQISFFGAVGGLCFGLIVIGYGRPDKLVPDE